MKQSVFIPSLFAPSLAIILLASTTTLTGCGKGGLKSFVRGVEFGEQDLPDGRHEGTLKVSLGKSLGALPAFEVPLENPAAPGTALGTIALEPVEGGGSALELRFDFASIELLQSYSTAGTSVTLPNGSLLPVGLPAGVKPVSVSFLAESQAYFALGGSTRMAGVALALPQFDFLSNLTGGNDLFIPFKLKNGMRATAGIFASRASGRSGIALFVELGAR